MSSFVQYLPESVKRRLRPYFSADIDRISKIVSRVPPTASVLDVGCVRHDLDSQEWQEPPPGEFLHADLRRRAETVVGLDLIEAEVKRMQEAGYDVRVSNAESFEMDRRIDVITAGELIEHLSNPGEFLDRCHEHLTEDGKLILTTPNPRRLHMIRWYAMGQETQANPEHTMWFDHYVIQELATRHGFRIANWEWYKPGSVLSTAFLYYSGLRPLGGGGYVFELRKDD
jgi:2-polyprenyl-3-methyl-5-hydroxy-6-metoxy-1,4-benzoquinol methylase